MLRLGRTVPTRVVALAILWLAAGLLLSRAAAMEQREPYVLGAYPFSPSNVAERIYGPIAGDLSKALGRPVIFRTKAQASAYLRESAEGRYDLVFLHPFAYVQLHEVQPYQPIARMAHPVRHMIVNRSGPPWPDLAALRNQTIGTASLDLPISLQLMALARRAGLRESRDFIRREFANGQDCLHQLVLMHVDACAVADISLRNFLARNDTRVLTVAYRMPPMPHALFAVHARVDRRDVATMQARILSWNLTEEGRALLERIRFTPFEPATDADYDEVRRMLKELKQ